MAPDKLRFLDFIDYLKKSPLAVTLALITLVLALLKLIYEIIERPGVVLVVLCALGSVLLFAYNIWIIDARKSPRSKKRLFSMKLRISVHVISFCVFLVCWVVVACMVPNRRAGHVLLKLGCHKLAARRLAEHLKIKENKDDKIAWHWLALAKLKEEHTEIMDDIRKGPSKADAYYWEGRIRYEDSNMPDAAKAYQNCIKEDQSYLRAYPELFDTLLQRAEKERKKNNIKDAISYLITANEYMTQGIPFAESAALNDSMVQLLKLLKCMVLNELAYAYAVGMISNEINTAIGHAEEAVNLSKEYDLSPLCIARCLDTLGYVLIRREDLKKPPLLPEIRELTKAEGFFNEALTLLSIMESQSPEDKEEVDSVRTVIMEHMRLLKTLQDKIKAEDG
jgi:tetratricopeptide (TPR) repeat protein